MSKTKWISRGLDCGECERYDVAEHDCIVGIVHCDPGDIEAFTVAAAKLVTENQGAEFVEQIKEPVWRWWRYNPDPTRYYPFVLAEASGPGRGNFRAARVLLRPVSA